MAAYEQATVTGTENTQGDLRRRNVPEQTHANGSYIPPELNGKLDEKTKQKVGEDGGLVNPRIPRGSLADDSLGQTNSILQILDDYEFIIAPLVFTALAFFTRMWKIGLSPIVTWDEAQYILTTHTLHV